MSTIFQNAYAVIIGINEYQSTIEGLQPKVEIAQQARTLTKALVHSGLGAYNPQNVLLLTGSLATRHNILYAFNWLENKLAADNSENATALVYIAGQHLSIGSSTHLIPYDLEEISQLSGKVISYALIARKLNNIGFSNALLILDSWETGLSIQTLREKGINPPIEDPDPSSGPRDPNSNSAGNDIPFENNYTYIIHHYPSSIEVSVPSPSFTHILAKAITGHASPKNGDTQIDVHDLIAYLFQQVPEKGEEKKALSAQVYGNSFPIANLLGGKVWDDSSTALTVDDFPNNNAVQNTFEYLKSIAQNVNKDVEAANFRENFSTRTPEGDKKALWALMVGIDEYAEPTFRLGGCVNDMRAFLDYLNEYCNNEDWVFIPKMLENGQATKTAIIQQFQEHLKANARDGDVCLFYYSGHGASIKSAPEFWAEHDGRHETLVVYDSRGNEGGPDLIDKELAYLIWDVTNGKDVHFVSVLDSCHAGSGTKLPDEEIRIRQVDGREDTQLTDYYGEYIHQTRDGETRLQPPKARHINLAAARSNETAKELRIDGKPRGAFTYELIAALRAYKNKLSYRELINNVRARVGSRVEKQNPQLDTIELEANEGLENLVFLNEAIKSFPDSFNISFSRDRASNNEQYRWIMDAGAIQGIVKENSQFRLVDEQGDPLLGANNLPIVADIGIHQVLLSETVLIVDESDDLWNDPNQEYHAVVARTRTKVAFSTNSEESAKAFVQIAIDNDSKIGLEIIQDLGLAEFVIYAENNRYSFHKKDSLKPIFELNQAGFNLNTAGILARNAHKVAQWSYVRSLSNQTSAITENNFEIKMSMLKEDGNFVEVSDPYGTDNSSDYYYVYGDNGEWAKNTDKQDSNFRYRREGSSWIRPQFKVEIINKNPESYWVSAPYLGYEYSITNVFLVKEQLFGNNNPDASPINLKDTTGAPNIPVYILANDHRNGRTEATEYIKVFISTDEFETNNFNQDGITTDVSLRPGDPGGRHAWTTRILPFNIILPFDVERENFNGITVNGLSEEVKILLISPNETSRLFGWVPPEKRGDDTLEGFELKPGVSDVPGLSVVELFHSEGEDFGGAGTPVELTLNPVPDFMVYAYGYAPDAGEFIFLGQTDDSGKIQIPQLPVATPCGTPGIEKSVKIFLRKVV